MADSKAKLIVHDEDKGGLEKKEIEFSYNPESIRVTKTVKHKEQRQAGQNAPKKQFTGGDSTKIEFGEIIFDTFESRVSVYTKHVRALECFITAAEKTHKPPRVMFKWGNAVYEQTLNNKPRWFHVSAFDVNYIMFLPDGTPVRAKVKLTLSEYAEKEPRGSPDTAHVHMVSRGDSLQSIAFSEYDDPSEWRRIADANGIDDPMALEAGRKLLIPPILK